MLKPSEATKPVSLWKPWSLLTSGLWVFALILTGFTPAHADGFADEVNRLPTVPMAEMEQTIGRLAHVQNPKVAEMLQAMHDGRLFYVKASGRMVFADTKDDGFKLTDALSGEALGVADRFEIKKIAVTNALRTVLDREIALLELNSTDVRLRMKSVKSVIQNPTPEAMALLAKQREIEKDGGVLEAINVALALADLSGKDKALRGKAIRLLEGNLNQDVRNRLSALQEKTDTGEYVEGDSEIRNLAAVALKKIEYKLELNHLAETLFFGLSLGAVLVLAAIGLAITFGVMGVINMAHGELMMLGAYTTYVVQLMMPNAIDYSLFVAIPAAFVITALVGIGIERGIIRFLYGRPLETLLATFGLSLILQQLVRSIFSPLNRSVSTPTWMSGSLEINSALTLTLNRFYIILFGLLVFWGLLMVLKRTRLGLEVRAVAQNRAMAKAMGIRTDWVDAMTFGLGSGIAGVAGVALSQLTNVGPNLGQAYIVDSFMVVVFGGVGNLWGTLVGGLTLGVADKILEPYAGTVLAKILMLLFIILFIQKRPRGLFPQKGRAAEG
ncbi:MAG: urea ABC transporter permease subunit UrtB [Candidatus Methylumidiphilus alinenensis]|uniref:Urea ABC transporter permease subunit UrtB n=1 Tax=Candidatus Methylumidiphilus alinenensis TaxID=2202197 RepID=A0A2W4SQY1_9GAMM|nr:MAG: urea ABC transporter permease subunit UrtB [Candidatus Methylumidiphilus alinenensis]